MSNSVNFQSEVAYIYSKDSTRWFDKLPSNIGRSSLVHALIMELGLHQMAEYRHRATYRINFYFYYASILEPVLSSKKFLEQYHSLDYLDIIFNDNKVDIDHLDSFGLVDDCSIFEGLRMYALYLGGSVEASLRALEKGYRYVINWDGGRHHAQASLASGFCFINDIVLLVLNMVEHYDKILYIDLDVHHGDGVENAFIFSDKVYTFSMHKYSPGFFPGSGGQNNQGKGKGIGYCLNLPINHKISGEGFYDLFNFTFSRIVSNFDPDVIVCVCGADVLSTDPHAAFNVGSDFYSKCIEDIVQTKIPSVFLGGGGYNHTSTAKLWSILTHKIISGCHTIPPLSEVVPEHEFWPLYADEENLMVPESHDYNGEKESHALIELKAFIENRI